MGYTVVEGLGGLYVTPEVVGKVMMKQLREDRLLKQTHLRVLMT